VLHGKLELLTVRLPPNYGGEAQEVGARRAFILGIKKH